MTTPETQLREIAELVGQVAGPGVGFALFFSVEGGVSYLSNADRDDVVKALEEWLEKTSGAGPSNKGERSEMADARLALERRCVELGKTIAGTGIGIVLFMFDFGEGGHMAYFSSVADARAGVRSWIASQVEAS